MRYAALTPALACLWLAPSVALSQGLIPAEADIAARLIDSQCLDLTEDTGCETLILLENTDQTDTADLLIVTDRRTDPPAAPLLVARQVAFNGSMWGMSPSIEAREGGGFFLLSEQIGMGRNPWTQTLTIAYRDGAFVVAGVSYSSYDRALGHHMGCDVNLLSGDYTTSVVHVVDDAGTEEETADAGRIAAAPTLLQDWQAFSPLPQPCRDAQALYYQ